MKEIDYIVGIFNCFSNDLDNPHNEKYFLLYLLDEKGMLDYEGSKELYKRQFSRDGLIDNKYIGPFDNLEALNQYAFALLEELNAAQVSLLSVQEYNLLIESTQQASDFHRDLLEKGNIIENIERKKKGFLSRFFD